MMRHTSLCVFGMLLILAGCEMQQADGNETVFRALDGGTDGGDDVGDSAADMARASEARLSDGLIAEWLFDSPDPTVASTRGSTPLILEQRADVESTDGEPVMAPIAGGGIRVDSGGYYLDDVPGEVYASMTDGDGFTLEMWVATDNREQRGPARIVTLSLDSSERNVTVGQQLDEWSLRFRHENSDLDPEDTTPYSNGLPGIFGPLAFTPLIHMVATYDGYFVTLWQNGQIVASAARPDGIGNWDTSYGLALMNEFEDSRQFVGDLYLFAMWDHALDPVEVKRNYLAGPGGDQ